MQSMSLNERQSTELCDRIGKMLVEQLNSDTMQNKIHHAIRDFVNQSNIKVNLDDLNNSIQVSVKVQIAK